MATQTYPRSPCDPRTEGIAMSSEIDYRVGSLLDEAEARRLAAGAARDGLRRRLGHVLVAVGRAVEGRTVVEATPARPGQPTAGVRA
jgi:hypothetical protein